MQTIDERTSKIDYDMLALLTHKNNIMVAHQGATPHF